MESTIESKEIWHQFEALPKQAKLQVAELITTFSETFQKNKESAPKKIVDKPFVGMWKDRKDIADSSTWVRELRKGEWEG